MSKTAVNLNLINPKNTWQPGDVVKGELLVTAGDQLEVKTLGITFKGKSFATARISNGNHSHTYSSEIVLFDFHQALCPDPFTLPAGTKSWPFEFTLPAQQEQDVRSDLYQSLSVFSSSSRPLLAPSFVSDNTDSECQIRYAIKAVLETKKMLSFDKKDVQYLRVLPYRANNIDEFDPCTESHEFSFKSLHLNPEIGDKKSLSLSQKWQSKFKSETLPIAIFDIAIESPGAVHNGDRVQVMLRLQHNAQKSSFPKPPTVILQEISVLLESDVHVQVMRLADVRVVKWTEKNRLGAWFGDNKVPEGGLDISKLIRQGLKIPDKVVPTFKTHNSALSYKFRIYYTISCAKQISSHEHLIDVVVLGPASPAIA